MCFGCVVSTFTSRSIESKRTHLKHLNSLNLHKSISHRIGNSVIHCQLLLPLIQQLNNVFVMTQCSENQGANEFDALLTHISDFQSK